MIAEIEADIAAKKLYLSPRLSAGGQTDYPDLLRRAARENNDTWLAGEIRQPGRLNAMEQKRTPSGGTTMARVPLTAHETLAEGEFNRFYVRGLCLRALAAGITELEIYRAKAVENPRSASVAKIGQRISAQALLNDLRTNIGVDTALGLPPGPNSGLSVRLP
ncbi:MAG TPA: hypothetical protein VEK73_22030 [Xanthobacteraceae bacterium]|nr:hypothetical protein [Xanthobacteraceae bacterium]